MKKRESKYHLYLLYCLAMFFLLRNAIHLHDCNDIIHTDRSYLINVFNIISHWQSNSMDEICNNAIDDDMDGLIDLNDSDCTCTLIEPVSLIPNPSFEDITCCPTGRSQLRCADVWIQASEPTTDLIHSCDWLGWEQFPPPLPFPDGEGILGFRDGRVRQQDPIPERNWKEYAGACLLGPLEADVNYRFEFFLGFSDPVSSPPIDITFFGTSDCANLPFGERDEAFGCPTNGPNWVELGATHVNGGNGNTWIKTFIEVTPSEDINAIAIGPSCKAVDAPMSIYYFFDNLVLSDLKSFDAQIIGTEHPCSESFSLAVGESPNFEYQWYKDGIALIGETDYQLDQMHGEGLYQVRTLDGGSCLVSGIYEHIIPTFSDTITEIICPNDIYSFNNQDLTETGIYYAKLKTEDNCDNDVVLQLEVLGSINDTIEATIFEGESYSIQQYDFSNNGEHIAQLNSSLGCDSIVLLKLDYYQIYIPSIFSPNNDESNDLFSLYSDDGSIENIELNIYDRWGELIYQGSSWDGLQNGSRANPGIYIYYATIRMNDGIERVLSGEVTLML